MTYYVFLSTWQGTQQNDELRRKRHEASRPNHILLFTIINPVYPITVVSTSSLFLSTFSPDYLLEYDEQSKTTACRIWIARSCAYAACTRHTNINRFTLVVNQYLWIINCRDEMRIFRACFFLFGSCARYSEGKWNEEQTNIQQNWITMEKLPTNANSCSSFLTVQTHREYTRAMVECRASLVLILFI